MPKVLFLGMEDPRTTLTGNENRRSKHWDKHFYKRQLEDISKHLHHFEALFLNQINLPKSLENDVDIIVWQFDQNDPSAIIHVKSQVLELRRLFYEQDRPMPHVVLYPTNSKDKFNIVLPEDIIFQMVHSSGPPDYEKLFKVLNHIPTDIVLINHTVLKLRDILPNDPDINIIEKICASRIKKIIHDLETNHRTDKCQSRIEKNKELQNALIEEELDLSKKVTRLEQQKTVYVTNSFNLENEEMGYAVEPKNNAVAIELLNNKILKLSKVVKNIININNELQDIYDEYISAKAELKKPLLKK